MDPGVAPSRLRCAPAAALERARKQARRLDWGRALGSYREALRADPRSAEAAKGCAICLEHLGRPEAHGAYVRALQLAPDDPELVRRSARARARARLPRLGFEVLGPDHLVAQLRMMPQRKSLLLHLAAACATTWIAMFADHPLLAFAAMLAAACFATSLRDCRLEIRGSRVWIEGREVGSVEIVDRRLLVDGVSRGRLTRVPDAVREALAASAELRAARSGGEVPEALERMRS